MRNYLKDKKIALWKSETRKVNGVNQTTYVQLDPFKIWAYYRQEGGTKKLTNVGLVVSTTEETAIFIVNSNSQLNFKEISRIVFNHKIYEIVVIDDYEGYKGDLKITVKLSTSQTFEKGLQDI